jgi:hypothetical protein
MSEPAAQRVAGVLSSTPTMNRRPWLVLSALAGLAACGGSESSSEGARSPTQGGNVTSIEIAELEITGGAGVDRFTSCPPAGELGQDWIPKLPPWAPPAKKAEGPPTTSDSLPSSSGDGRTPTEKAVFETYPEFRRCYQRGLLRDPTQDGHAAIVARVGPDGRVAAVESYGVCELSSEVIACMKGEASKLRFDAPPGGSATITIPAVFTTRGGRIHDHPSANDAYTAAAYVTLEEARPALHDCDAAARRAGQDLQASASFQLDVDGDGRVMHTHVDNWRGNQELLSCGAHALERIVFDKPPAGRGAVLARITFNPRAGTK